MSLRALRESCAGTMSLTFSQLFMGALTIGIGTFRGTESYLSFYYETQVGHSNYAASKLGADHARAANTNANNNVISAGVMGPRFAVEADVITMITTAAVACPQAHYNAHMAKICAEFMANSPRAFQKLAWVRLKQEFIWGQLGNLTSTIDGVASRKAIEQVKSTLSDKKVSIRAEDPSTSGNIWGGNNTSVGCSLAQQDTLKSEMPGEAFRVPLMENLFHGLPQVLVATLPQAICGATSLASGGGLGGLTGGGGLGGLTGGGGSLMGGGGSGGGNSGKDSEPIRLPQIPSIWKATTEQCGKLENQMADQIAQAKQSPSDDSSDRHFRSGDGENESKGPVFSNEISPYVRCAVATPEKTMRESQSPHRASKWFAPASGLRGPGGFGRNQSNASYSYFDPKAKQIVSCTFDRDKCADDKLETNTTDFLHSRQLPAKFSESNLGGATHAPGDSDWNHSDSMRACTYSSAEINKTIADISDAVRTVSSFGQASTTSTLREKPEYQACAKWYFPDGPGSEFAVTPHDQQPFVAAWKYAMVAGRKGGSL